MKKLCKSTVALVMAVLMMLSCTGTAFAAGSYGRYDYSDTTEYTRLVKLCEELDAIYGLRKKVDYANEYNSIEYQIKTAHNNYEKPIWDYLSRSTRRSIEGMTAYQAAFKLRESTEYKDTSNTALRREVDYVIAYLTNNLCDYMREPLEAFYPSGTLKVMDIEQLIALGEQVVSDKAYRQLTEALDYCYTNRGQVDYYTLRYTHPDDLNAYYADISEALLTFWLPNLTLS